MGPGRSSGWKIRTQQPARRRSATNSGGIWRLPKPSRSTSTPTPARQRSPRAWTSSLATGPWPYAYWAKVIVRRAERTASSMAGKICSPLSRRSTRFPTTTGDDVYAPSSAPSAAGVSGAEGSTTRGGRRAHATAEIARAAVSAAWRANRGRGGLTGSKSRFPFGSRGTPRSAGGGRVRRDPDQLLPEVPPFEEAGQGGRSRGEPLDHVLPVLEPALVEPTRTIGQEGPQAVGVIRDDEALHEGAVREDRQQVGAGRQLGRVVLGDQAAERDAGVPVDQLERRRQGRPAHVVEVDIDSVRARRLQRGKELLGPVVDTGLEAELRDHVVAFVLGAGDADDVAALDPGDLPDHGAHGARRRRHENGLAGRGPADVEESDVRGHPRHAEHPERGRDRRLPRVELPHPRPGRHGVGLPAVVAGDEVAAREPRVPRLDHLADGAADHDLPELDRRRVGSPLVHAAAHVRVDRQVERATEYFALPRRWDRRLRDFEVLEPGRPDGPASEQYLAVHGGWLNRTLRPRPPGTANATSKHGQRPVSWPGVSWPGSAGSPPFRSIASRARAAWGQGKLGRRGPSRGTILTPPRSDGDRIRRDRGDGHRAGVPARPRPYGPGRGAAGRSRA